MSMFVDRESEISIKKYRDLIKSIAGVSKLYSESSTPYLGYRVVENMFCRAFNATNLSRGDCSADASKNGVGIGIKTFLNNGGRTLQKVAEFNRDMSLFNGRTSKQIVQIIAELRNQRINATKRIHSLDSMIYHCVVREDSKVKVFECPMDLVEIDEITNIRTRNNTITFEDGINEYSINLSKSTLYKRFITEKVLIEIDIEIINDPYELLINLLIGERNTLIFAPIISDKEYIFLPLYSDQGGRHIPEKSGLNQWNGVGRVRDSDEIYIPIPAWIHKKFPDFFPNRDIPFTLVLPDGKEISSKICQDGGKALMSNPNKALGKWILRQVMNLEERELLTYKRLEELGLDSVVIYKEEENRYSINFTEIGSFDSFKEDINR